MLGIIISLWSWNVNRQFRGNAPVHGLIQRADWPPRLAVFIAVQVAAVLKPSVEELEGLVVVAGLLVGDAEVQIETVN